MNELFRIEHLHPTERPRAFQWIGGSIYATHTDNYTQARVTGVAAVPVIPVARAPLPPLNLAPQWFAHEEVQVVAVEGFNPTGSILLARSLLLCEDMSVNVNVDGQPVYTFDGLLVPAGQVGQLVDR